MKKNKDIQINVSLEPKESSLTLDAGKDLNIVCSGTTPSKKFPLVSAIHKDGVNSHFIKN